MGQSCSCKRSASKENDNYNKNDQIKQKQQWYCNSNHGKHANDNIAVNQNKRTFSETYQFTLCVHSNGRVFMEFLACWNLWGCQTRMKYHQNRSGKGEANSEQHRPTIYMCTIYIYICIRTTYVNPSHICNYGCHGVPKQENSLYWCRRLVWNQRCLIQSCSTKAMVLVLVASGCFFLRKVSLYHI